MPTIYQLKPAFQRLLRPSMSWLHGHGVTPNQLTIAAGLMSLATGVAVAVDPSDVRPLVAVPIVLLVRMALNALDGMMAREFGLQTPLGGVLNEIGDVLSDAALYLPLAIVPGCHPALVVALVVLGIVSEMAGLLGRTRRYDGPLGKSDRAFAFGVVALLLASGRVRPGVIAGILSVLVFAAVVTIVNRCRHAVSEKAG